MLIHTNIPLEMKKYNYLDFTIVDDVFLYFFLHDFMLVFMILKGIFMFFFPGIVIVFVVFHGFKFIIVNDAIFLPKHQESWFRTDVFEVHWPSRVIISDGRQPSIQRCDVCDVSLKSKTESFREICQKCASRSTIHTSLCSKTNSWISAQFCVCSTLEKSWTKLLSHLDNHNSGRHGQNSHNAD